MSLACTKSRATRDAGVCPIMRNAQRDLIRLWINAPLRQSQMNLLEKRLEHPRDASTDHDDIGIEQIDNASQPRSHEFDCLSENLLCHRISGGICPRHGLAGDR